MQEASPQMVGIDQSHAKTSAWVLRVTLDVSLDRMASVASLRAHLISRRCLSESSPFVTYLRLFDAEAASSSALRTLSISARQRLRCRNELAPWYRRPRTHLASPAGWSQGAHARRWSRTTLVRGFGGHPS